VDGEPGREPGRPQVVQAECELHLLYFVGIFPINGITRLKVVAVSACDQDAAVVQKRTQQL
jgi:hypothetical protein